MYTDVLKQKGRSGFAIPEKAPHVGSFPLYPIERARYAIAIVAAPHYDAEEGTRQRVLKAVYREHPSLLPMIKHALETIERRKRKLRPNPPGLGAGLRVAAKMGGKLIPFVGMASAVVGGGIEAGKAGIRAGKRVKKEGFTREGIVRATKQNLKEAPKDLVRVGAGALGVGDFLPASWKPNPRYVRRNPDYVAEVARLLATMPSDWSAQLASNRRKMEMSGADARFIVPERPTVHTILRALNLNNQGEMSSEAKVGQAPANGQPIPDEVREAAYAGLVASHKNNYGGYDFIGVARAIQLVISPTLSKEAQNRMRMYFDRKTKPDRLSQQYKDKQGKRYWSWLNWGGDAGALWVGSKRFRELVLGGTEG
jgi:hypothetical protein